MATPQAEVTVASPEHFKFTDLPGELRNKIVKLAVQTDKKIFICFQKRKKKYKLVARIESKDHSKSKRGRKSFTPIKDILAPSLLLASKQMHNESIGHFMMNDLHFSCPRAFDRFQMALERKTDLAHLRRVSIDKVQLGKYEKSFEAFLHAPNLEMLQIDFGHPVGTVNVDRTRPDAFSEAVYRSLAGWLNGLDFGGSTRAVNKIVFKAGNKFLLPTTRQGSMEALMDPGHTAQRVFRRAALARHAQIFSLVEVSRRLPMPTTLPGWRGM